MPDQELLALGTEAKNAQTVCEAFTAPLRSYLLSALDGKDAVKNATPMMKAECRRIVVEVRRLAAPMGRDAVYVALQPCLILFGSPDFGDVTDKLQASWLAIYQEALHDLPKEALEWAVSDWIANGKPFFPKPTELNGRAKAKAIEARTLAWRCQMVAAAAAAEASRVVVSADEAVERRNALKAVSADLRVRGDMPFEERFASRRREPSHA